MAHDQHDFPDSNVDPVIIQRQKEARLAQLPGKPNENERVQELLEQANPTLVYNQLVETIDKAHHSNVAFELLGMEDIKYFLKDWELPGMSLNQSNYTQRRDGMHDSYRWKLPGDELTMDTGTLTFFCDEKMILYERFLDLIRRTSQRLIEYLLIGTLYFFDNVHHKCFFTYVWQDCWVQNVSGIKSVNSSPGELEFSVTFEINSPLWSRNPEGV